MTCSVDSHFCSKTLYKVLALSLAAGNVLRCATRATQSADKRVLAALTAPDDVGQVKVQWQRSLALLGYIHTRCALVRSSTECVTEADAVLDLSYVERLRLNKIRCIYSPLTVAFS